MNDVLGMLISLPVDKALRKAQSHIKAGELTEAEELYKQVLSKFPKNKKAIQGNQKLKAGITSKGSSISEPPQEQVQELISLYNQGQLTAAIDQAQILIQQYPRVFFAWNILGAANKSLGRVLEASKALKKVTELNPNYADGFNNIGVTLTDQGKLEEAIEALNKALSLKPNYAEAYYNLGNALQGKSDLDAAIDSYKQAIRMKPDYAEAYGNMGVSLNDKGELDAAIDSYKQAIKIKPDYAEAHVNLSFAFLNNGRLKEGLDEYEWRWKTAKNLSKMRHFSKPLWDGVEKLKGQRILIWGEQGPQDMTIWSPCLPYLSFHAEHCIVECPKKLVPLLARSFPKVEVKAENRSLDNHRDDFDFHLPMGSLFRHFIPEISAKTKPGAFLIPDPARVNFWKERLNSLGTSPFVGISWKSPLVKPERLPNYTRIPDWTPVLALPNATFINLQSSDFRDDLAAIQAEFGVTVHNFEDLDHYDNLDDVAALSAALDIVVSVSTAVSAITAGVGTPTKLAAWRQSAWNNILLAPRGPSVEAFERNTWEPWDNVFQSVARDIADFQVA